MSPRPLQLILRNETLTGMTLKNNPQRTNVKGLRIDPKENVFTERGNSHKEIFTRATDSRGRSADNSLRYVLLSMVLFYATANIVKGRVYAGIYATRSAGGQQSQDRNVKAIAVSHPSPPFSARLCQWKERSALLTLKCARLVLRIGSI